MAQNQSSSTPSTAGERSDGDARKERGAALTGWLLFVIFVNSVFALIYFGDGPALLPSLAIWAIYSLGVLATATVALSLLLFAWVKLAFYGQCIVASIIFVLNVVNGVSLPSATLGLTGLVVLYLLLRPKWNLLK